MTEAVTGSANAGDPVWLPQDQPGAHGTGDDRITAFMAGYLGGLLGCGISLVEVRAGQVAMDGAPSGDDAGDLVRLLPTEEQVPPGLAVTEEVRRSLLEVATGYADPAEAERLFAEWGWRGQAGRRFGPAPGVRLAPTATAAIYVSLHRFGDAAGAAAAVDYWVDDQTATTPGARAVEVGAVGEHARALTVEGPGGNEVTVYAQTGDLLIRVTAAAPAGDPIADALTVARLVVANAG